MSTSATNQPTDDIENRKPVPDYEEFYSVSSSGVVKTITRRSATPAGTIVKTRVGNKHGDVVVSLSKDGKQTNILLRVIVARAFCPRPDGADMVFIMDGNKNNNAASNLRWVKRGEVPDDAEFSISLPPGNWKPFPVEKFSRAYKIRDDGCVWRVVKSATSTPGEILGTIVNGYKKVLVSSEGEIGQFFVHRLVAMAFVQNPDDLPHVNHKDGIRSNPSSDNLEWCTNEENNFHASTKLRTKMWQPGPSAIAEIKSRTDNGDTAGDIAEEYGILPHRVSEICAMTDAAVDEAAVTEESVYSELVSMTHDQPNPVPLDERVVTLPSTPTPDKETVCTATVKARDPEVWVTIPKYSDYSVSSFGRVRRDLDTKGNPCNSIVAIRYLRGDIARVNISVGSGAAYKQYTEQLVDLVVSAFCPKPEYAKERPIRLNGDLTDCRATNLAWVVQRPRILTNTLPDGDWKPIPIREFSKTHVVDSQGRVAKYANGLHSAHILHGTINTNGYVMVRLWNDKSDRTIGIHRLVAMAFLPNKDRTMFTEVNHLNGNRRSNFVSNLEWCSPKQNKHHQINMLRKHNWTPTRSAILGMKKKREEGMSVEDIAKHYGVLPAKVEAVLRY